MPTFVVRPTFHLSLVDNQRSFVQICLDQTESLEFIATLSQGLKNNRISSHLFCLFNELRFNSALLPKAAVVCQQANLLVSSGRFLTVSVNINLSGRIAHDAVLPHLWAGTARNQSENKRKKEC